MKLLLGYRQKSKISVWGLIKSFLSYLVPKLCMEDQVLSPVFRMLPTNIMSRSNMRSFLVFPSFLFHGVLSAFLFFFNRSVAAQLLSGLWAYVNNKVRAILKFDMPCEMCYVFKCY